MKKEKIFIDPFDDLGFAKVDVHREKRKGFPEVIFCEGKTKKQIVDITARIKHRNNKVLLTRVSTQVAKRLKKKYPQGKFYREARIFYVGPQMKPHGLVTVLTGGTADIPVAEEAAVTAEVMGSEVQRFYDVGVAGIHRLLSFRKEIETSRVLIVVAGMDGVLASVAGGLFSKPIIAVPTSIGYGLSLKGITPLLTMLNSCAPAVAVVNIDNGFGAGYIAATINKL
ncbi:1-(5-phosphoribosyl)-5-amino-4-imidazole-carboxylate carboxylase [candidate division TA06 bacterium DG_78]|uniref:1-(5-phosphoribosyl)-5-amino-4-imidazole-carboxylate carboxylase n=1 Tax=candidate division TA06 bacterium DG_78 TaxID=1703772 RepID=A0A0S7YHM3_UNCT6|nr:MAG: 1-(5-phosphoribosyl)-5-amino-4-imidazole-carboxylate carboxylase [candidate division TA06 bacterium DG_78]